MRSEPTPRNVIATIILLSVLMFVKLVMLRAALWDSTDFLIGVTAIQFLFDAAIVNIAVLSWGLMIAWRYRTPSDARVVLIFLTVGDAILLVGLLVARYAAG